MTDVTPKTYKINLDIAPELRWNKVIEDHLSLFPNVLNHIDQMLKSYGFMGKCAQFTCKFFHKIGSIMYKKELTSISKQANIPIDKLILIQIIYEMCACCTSVVIPIQTGNDPGYNLHFRTMDWEMDFLRDLTINVEFYKKGRLLFKGVTWAGYVGIVTGMNESYSIAINYRRSNGTIMGNMMRTLRMKWPIGYLTRHIYEQDLWFSDAREMLQFSPLIAPCYITLCASTAKIGNSVVLVRDNKETVNIKHIGFEDRPYLVQTNCDDNEDINNIMWSHERVRKVEQLACNYTHMDTDEIIDLVLNKYYTYPIINAHTIYVCVMVPNEFRLKTLTIK
jgi:acid ceramidase